MHRPPLSMVGELFVKIMSSSRIKLTTRLFLTINTKPTQSALGRNPFRRAYLHRIGRIRRSHTVGGASGSTMVVMFVGSCVGGQWYFLCYSYRRNPMGWEFFVSSRNLIVIAVNLLTA